MIRMMEFLQRDCPPLFKKQILELMKQEWPHAFTNEEDLAWPENEELHPTSLILIDDEIMVSHVGIVWTYLEHEGVIYKAFGLSEVMTYPAYRKKGFGLRLIREAVKWIKKNDADIGIFTCDDQLVHFYESGGWEHIKHTCLVGGTVKKPFRSDQLEKVTLIRFFSENAQINRHQFEGKDIHLELGEGKLW